MSSKIVFKINGNKDLSEISLVNVQKQLDNLIENINQGILSLKKKKNQQLKIKMIQMERNLRTRLNFNLEI